MLGCGEWKAVVASRGGSPVRYNLDYENFSYTAPLSSASRFSVNLPISGTSPSCCEIIVECDPWADEVAFYRNGVFAFAGPLIDMELKPTGMEMSGKDLLNGWMEKRFIDDDLTYYQDIAEVFGAVVEYGLSKDPSPNFEVHTRNVGTKGNRTYEASAYRKCSDVLNELTGTELDYVVSGRRVYAGDLDALLDPDPILLSDEAVADISISKLGGNLTNDLVMIGEIPARETTQVAGRATRGVDHYGLLQDSIVDLLLRNVEDCEDSALQRLRAQYPIPLMVKITLSPQAEVEFSDLLAGRTVKPLFSGNLACLEVLGEMRLEEVGVRDDANGEKVSLNLVPIGVDE